MPTERVLDASVAAKCFFEEVGSDSAVQLVRSTPRLIAPDLIHAELASIAAKKVRRGEVTHDIGLEAVRRITNLLHEVVPVESLSERAFVLAVEVGCSVYDGLYLSLAEARGCRMATADERLVRRATSANLGHLVEQLQERSEP